jgi:hypothetical protein
MPSAHPPSITSFITPPSASIVRLSATVEAGQTTGKLILRIE